MMEEPQSHGRTEWQPRIRWFIAEFLVVLAGIGAALLVQAWLQKRTDHAAERAYLRQISADLAQTSALMTWADTSMRRAEHAGAAMIDAYQAPTPPPSDSVFIWLRDLRLYNAPRPVLGTIQALISTGDLKLIRSDSLRAAIVEYLDHALHGIESEQSNDRMAADAYVAMNSIIDYSDLMAVGDSLSPRTDVTRNAANPYHFVRPGGRISRFGRSAQSLLADRNLAAVLVTLQISKRGHKQTRVGMRKEADALRAMIVRELGDQLPPSG